MATSLAAREVVWFRKLLAGLFGQISEPTLIHHDNQSCVQMSANPIFHDKSKHTEIRYHFIHDMVQKGVVKLQYISTYDEIIDFHTKPLPRMKLEYFNKRLGSEENVSLFDRER